MRTHSNNYWQRRGATPAAVIEVCKELGLNPASGNHLMSAFEILKGRIVSRSN